MIWIAPSGSDSDNAALEQRRWDAAEQAVPGPHVAKTECKVTPPEGLLGFRFRRFAEVRFAAGSRPGALGFGLFLLLSGSPGLRSAAIILPGTQPTEGGIEFGKVSQCVLCHAGTKNGAAAPYASWHGSLMGQAARDAVFRAGLAIAHQDVKGVGEFCIRCHAPRGWLAGRSEVAERSKLTPEDLHGVSCEICQHLVAPLSGGAKQLVKRVPPG